MTGAGAPRGAASRLLAIANLSLLALFPLAWAAPLARTSLLPFLSGDAISVAGAVATLWDGDPALAALIALFGMAMPYAKTLALAALHLGRLPRRALPALELLGKLSMADVFLIALAIVIAKGIGIGRVETAWGLWLFTGCVLASLAISLATGRVLPRPG